MSEASISLTDLPRKLREISGGSVPVPTYRVLYGRVLDGATLPIVPVLQEILDASPSGDLTFLVTEHGKPFTDAGFGNWFGDRCKEAGVPGRAHGLRKAGATIAANNGATAHQLMGIFGWDTLKMAEAYTRAADQQRLAASAMHMLAATEQHAPESVPPTMPVRLSGKTT